MKQKTNYEAHPYAAIFPLAEGQPLWDMATDIKENGLGNEIVLYQGKILDGRRRDLACVRAEVKPKYRQFKGNDAAALAFVVSQNLHRRHLGEADRALVAAQIATMKQGRQESNSSTELFSQEQAGKMVGVSKGSVKRAVRIKKKGTKSVNALVAAGGASLADAEAIVSEDAQTQNAAAEAVASGQAETLAEAVEDIQEEKANEDKAGHPVTKKAVDAFTNLAKFEALDTLCRQLQAGINELAQLPGGEQLARRLQATKSGENIIHKNENLNALKRDLRGTRPHSICPWCEGAGAKGCKGCSGTGWVTKVTWDGADEKTKARVA